MDHFTLESLGDWLQAWVPDLPLVHTLAGLSLLLVSAWLAQWLVSHLVLRIAGRVLRATGRGHWSQALVRHRVHSYFAYSVPLLIIGYHINLVPNLLPGVSLVSRLALVAGWLCFFTSARKLLSALQDVYAQTPRAQTRSIKGYVQLGKIALLVICVVLAGSILLGRSPLLLLSGVGAISAVLLLVFKDTLLSLVASTQLTSNDMLRIGDWIEMPQAGADGFVVDIALHTVKVQNWDKTVTTIPTYKLFSESYRNWRHMFESGGRRIKRTLRIDARSVRFLSDEECHELSRFRLLHDYLDAKQQAVQQSNEQLGELAQVPANRRRLTNLGTFRVYALAYLREHAEIHREMTLMVRMMEPESDGIPVEIYCFTATTAWVDYERIQGDIFDHLLAVLPELGLRLYQSPSGADLGGWAAQAGAWRQALPESPDGTVR